MKKNLYLIFVLVIAFFLRFYGINWDNGFHFHPDERMLIMVADRIQFFSQLNPDFFNYGSFPVYTLKGLSQIIDLFVPTNIATYDGMLYVGRSISLVNDLLVLVLIYKLAYLLFDNKKAALFSILFYTLSFFPIQNSHFFIVDTFLNLFGTLLIYLLLLYFKNPKPKLLFFISITFAAAVTTKISALIFLPVIGLVFFLSSKGKVMQKITASIVKGFYFLIPAIFISFIFMPFGFIHYNQFFSEISVQLRMNSDPYTFPYTLQYVGTIPYLYYLKNIAIWGVGPFIFVYFLLGLYEIFVKVDTSKIKTLLKHTDKKKYAVLIFFIFYGVYFIAIGKSAVKFMRYMLIMYPFMAILAGYGMSELIVALNSKTKKLVVGISFLLIGIWTLAFVNIYSQEATRIRATEWINQFIPSGSTLAVEHWDDRVPIFDPGKYNYEEMTLYELPDDEMKWNVLNQKLARTDYIIIASNRLYVPLQKLKECKESRYCYPKTAEYYENLFSGNSNFIKMAEFTSYPHIPFGPWTLEIVDDSADESFTVYDHPKILIYRREN